MDTSTYIGILIISDILIHLHTNIISLLNERKGTAIALFELSAVIILK